MPTSDDDDYEDPEYSDYSEDEDDTIPCPYCREPVYEDAVQCPACGNYISREDAPSRTPMWIVITVGGSIPLSSPLPFFLLSWTAISQPVLKPWRARPAVIRFSAFNRDCQDRRHDAPDGRGS